MSLAPETVLRTAGPLYPHQGQFICSSKKKRLWQCIQVLRLTRQTDTADIEVLCWGPSEVAEVWSDEYTDITLLSGRILLSFYGVESFATVSSPSALPSPNETAPSVINPPPVTIKLLQQEGLNNYALTQRFKVLVTEILNDYNDYAKWRNINAKDPDVDVEDSKYGAEDSNNDNETNSSNPSLEQQPYSNDLVPYDRWADSYLGEDVPDLELPFVEPATIDVESFFSDVFAPL
ncbi:MAG: hypothetical protein Q9160_009293 [Pyrenula sp. 1 TL-2023]